MLPPIRGTHAALLGALVVIGVLVGASSFEPRAIAGSAPQAAAAALAVQTAFPEVAITAQSAYVFDAATGQELYSKNPDTPLALASVTKLMLALTVSDFLKPEDIIPISETALSQEGDSGLLLGELWRMQDLLDFTLIMSSNDGAQALAEAAAPAIRARFPEAPTGAQATIWRMNEKAKEMGLSRSYFLSASGLDASETMAGAYGSARDMAILMATIAREHTEAILQTAEASRSFTSLDGTAHTAYNTNETLGNIPGLIAGKTGFTDIAGGNLVVVFDTSIGHPIVIAVLGSTRENRFSDVETLVDATRKTIAQ